jgi:aminoglycoside phosphotransferase (APT) family kinase protein
VPPADPADPPDPAIIAFLRASGLVGAAGTRLTPLTGGVASDIFKVEADGRVFVVKRALARLRVAQDWRAPVSRNAAEVAWLRRVAEVVPQAVPQVLAHDPAAGMFAMSYFDPARHPVWKLRLLAGEADGRFAAAVGRTIAAIHAATAFSDETAAAFAHDDVFHAIRLEPYLEATAQAHPDLCAALMGLSRDALATKVALVHGDVSPKNILIAGHGPILLDAECAWFGEPAFDLAFCLNHLLLKCLARPPARAGFLRAFDALAAAYLADVSWEPASALEERAARLLPALLLARVDGKSPVEYLTSAADKAAVRAVARPLIAQPAARLAAVRAAFSAELAS